MSAGKRGAAAGTVREVEWQFDALDLRPVERWLATWPGEASGLTIGPGTTRQILDVYADTADWRMYRAGYSLRLRRAGGRWQATLKSLEPAGEGPRRRTEVTEPVDGGDPVAVAGSPGPVGRRLRAVAGRHPLVTAFAVRTRRTTFPLSANGHVAAELVLD
ncbi:MAG TPA: CYTH domain-containing protein, partial [Actinomycetota bacterium]|nr:CYTH domain-containing protein [Actinomycetota bacterium]